MYPEYAATLADHEAVLQAEGFVALQLGVLLDVAADVLATYATAQHRALPEVAQDVLDGRITFGTGGA